MSLRAMFQVCFSILEPLTRSYSERNSDRNRDYDGLKQQCDKAIHELQQLRR